MEKRKTIGGEDILYAMVTLGFEQYAETLKIHLAKLRQVSLVLFPLYLVRLLLRCSTNQRQLATPDKKPSSRNRTNIQLQRNNLTALWLTTDSRIFYQ